MSQTQVDLSAGLCQMTENVGYAVTPMMGTYEFGICQSGRRQNAISAKPANSPVREPHSLPPQPPQARKRAATGSPLHSKGPTPSPTTARPSVTPTPAPTAFPVTAKPSYPLPQQSVVDDGAALCAWAQSMAANGGPLAYTWLGSSTTTMCPTWTPSSGLSPAWCGWAAVTCDPTSYRVVAVDTTATNADYLALGGGPADAAGYLHLPYAGAPLPAQLAGLNALTRLSLPNQNINGTLPSWLGSSLPNLAYLNLFNNQLTGQVPGSMAALSKLTFLNLGTVNTGQSGLTVRPAVWASMWAPLSALQLLNVDGLAAGVAPSPTAAPLTLLPLAPLAALTNLRHLSLKAVKFRATLGTWLGGLTRLQYLSLEGWGSGLVGPLPSYIGKLKALQYLGVHYGVNGTLPVGLGALSSLQAFRLDQGSVIGALPSSLLQLTALTALSVRAAVTGTIPYAITKLQNLNELTLDAPLTVDKSVFNLRGLTALYLSQCSLANRTVALKNALPNIQRLELNNIPWSGLGALNLPGSGPGAFPRHVQCVYVPRRWNSPDARA